MTILLGSPATRIKVFQQLAGGLIVCSIPVAVWWKSAADNRAIILEQQRTKVRVPNIQDSDDLLVERMQAGDVLLFDRRCEKCAAGPWAALACLAGRSLLCDERATRSVDQGRFDHVGIIVPGYIKTRHDEFDASNLLLMEATPSGIVARPLKQRLECTQSRSVILLPLCSPGEKRSARGSDYDDENSPPPLDVTVKTRKHIEQELKRFRDRWIDLGKEKRYESFHSTVALGGALAYGLGIHDMAGGPVSPAAYLALLGLQQAGVAQNIREKDSLSVKVEDFLRDYRVEETNAVRLRPGFRFLASIPVRETSRS